MNGAILVINAGSSSLKFQVFTVEEGSLQRQVRGQLDGIGGRPHLRAVAADGAEIIDRAYGSKDIPDLPAAIREAGQWLRTLEGLSLIAVGHRVVHGGPDFSAPVVIDEEILNHLAEYQDLAPLHQPNNLLPIRLAMQISPGVPQVACFDTAFHRTHPPVADRYAIPLSYYDEGVRRYGFHGLSYEFIAERLRDIAPAAAGGKVIVAHLGSGASMCAMKAGRSLDSTMGFTALDGLPMGTRPGQVDPGVVLYLISQRGMSADEVSDLFYHRSGLKGLSGISNDMRALLASDAPEAAFAIDHFAYRCGLNAGMMAAAMEGLDAFIFTAGIGENSAPIRQRICDRLRWLGVEIDAAANEAGETLISAPGSRVAVHLIPTDEELMIARHTLALIG